MFQMAWFQVMIFALPMGDKLVVNLDLALSMTTPAMEMEKANVLKMELRVAMHGTIGENS